MASPTSDSTPHTSSAPLDPNIPALPPDATPEQKDRHWFQHVYQGDKMPQFTVRAVLMGGILGMLMSASNLYTTLSIGWAFGVAITACVMSYVIWTIVRAISLNSVSKMSILENTCMASTASAAGYSTGSTIATMFGALMILHVVPTGQTSADVKTWDIQPVWLVATFTFLTGAMGCFLAIPMKRQMINHEQLPFPSGIAAAETLKSLYSESVEALHKAYALVVSLLVGGIVGILNTGEGTLIYIDRAMEKAKHMLGFEPRLPEQYPAGGFMQVQGKPLIGFGFEPSVLLIAAGMIVGLRVCTSMLLGSILLYFFVAPSLINMDAAHAGQTNYIPSIELVAGGTIYHVYRWGLWGGTALMVFASLTSLAMQWKTMGRAFGKFFKKEQVNEHSELESRMAQVEVPTLWLILGMVPITIGMIALQYMAFNISIYAGLIAVALSFVLSLVACRATGETDTTPIGAMGKVMQLTFAALHPKQIIPNLASAGIAANSASSSADLLTDLKSGYLLGANPRKQFLAQFAGIFFGTIAIVPVWYLMVPTKAALEKFPAPATNQWARVAQVLTEGIDKLPMSAQYSIVIGALLGVLLPVGERLIPQSARKFWPSAMGLGLSWVLPFANAFAFMIGAIIAFIWEKINKRTAETFTVPIASGLVAGESLIKAIIAMTATVVGLLGWDK